MLNPKHNLSGFTLVELLIGIAILGILLATAAPSFNTWIQNSQIRTASESISTGLQLARAEAVRRNTSVTFTLNADSSWNFGCTTAVGDLDGDGNADCPAPIQTRVASEGSRNAVINLMDNTAVTFNGLGRATAVMNIGITNPTGGTCKASSGDMRCLSLSVNVGGQIRMCDPALPNTDAQGC